MRGIAGSSQPWELLAAFNWEAAKGELCLPTKRREFLSWRLVLLGFLLVALDCF